MIWLKDIRGQKVIYEGKCIGKIVQGALCDSLTALDGLWVDRAMLGLRFISAEHICVLGRHAAVVDHQGDRLRMKPEQLLIRAVSTDGIRLGAVYDAAVDEHSLSVRLLALNPGFADFFRSGPIFISRFRYVLATSRIIVHETETEVES